MRLGISVRPLLKGRGGVVVCDGTGELSDRGCMKFGMQIGLGDD